MWVELLDGVRLPGVFDEAEIHVGRTYRPSPLERYDHIPPGGGRLNLPVELQAPCWRRKPTGTTDVLGRLSWDVPALTIRTEFHKPEKGRYLHPQWDLDDPARRVNRRSPTPRPPGSRASRRPSAGAARRCRSPGRSGTRSPHRSPALWPRAS